MEVELCKCHEAAKLSVVKKPGKNEGRSFWVCASNPSKCNHFRWADVEPSHNVPQPPPTTAATNVSYIKITIGENNGLVMYITPDKLARLFMD